MKQQKKNFSMDLTRGSIPRQILLFALPLLISSLIQQMYSTVDLLFVGNFLGKEASAAIGASSLIVTCMVNFFTGLSLGVNVLAAQYFGRKEETELDHLVHTAAGLSLLGGIVLIVTGITLSPSILRLMNTPESIMPMAVQYIRIYFCSTISMIGYNMAAGICRALGNSSVPTRAQFFGCIVNVIVDALFIVVFQWGIAGAAAATAFSQTAAMAVTVYYLMKGDSGCRLRPAGICLRGDYLKKILKIGVPAGVQASVITLSNMVVQYYINSLGVNSIAAFTVYFRIELILYLPVLALGQTMTTFAGQNYGARRFDRIQEGTRFCILAGAALIFVMGMAMMTGGSFIISLFNSDPGVISEGMKVIRITFPLYWLYVLLEVSAGAVRGLGSAVVPMGIVLWHMCFLRVVLLTVVMHFYHEIQGIAALYPVTWFLTGTVMYLYFRMTVKKLQKLQ
ncbi:MAG: MATE family efflux transporter [Lachnospiraceae bacterium]|nr:MATE family efflux transporter [Lachnospiraceae bacterium]